MGLNEYTLLSKKKLTSDVFELQFQAKDSFDFLPGQFVTFILPKIWWRAYSILKAEWKVITLIIKKRTQEMWWRWWSAYICDLEKWHSINGTNPAWKFLLQNNNTNKLFIGTGTWFVPLYNQIIHALKNNQSWKLELLFWARRHSDLFYISELELLKNNHSNFNFHIYLSREETTQHNIWYVTNFLNKKSISLFEEYYVCWIPQLIDESVKTLKNFNIDIKNIFTEKY